MKKLYTIFSMLILMLGLSTVANAQSWDFTSLKSEDAVLLTADQTQKWKSLNGRWGYMDALDKAALIANGQELTYASGLKFTVSAPSSTATEGNIRVGADTNNKRMWLSGNSVITIPNVQKDYQITVKCKSSSSSEVRGINTTNITAVSGSFDKTSKDEVTNIGTATETGDVTLTMNGAMYIYSIKVEAPSAEPDAPVVSDDYSVMSNSTKNQAILTLNDDTKKYYNTASLESIDFSGANVTMNLGGNKTYTFNGNVSGIGFRKAENASGDIDNPAGAVEITEAKGWLETAYIKFKKYDGAKTYNVYVKGGQYADYTKIDAELIREYNDYGRADAVGLLAGNYSIKIEGVNEAGDVIEGSANEATNIAVKNYNRDGYAHYNATEGIGAYKNDGTLKDDARVIYVTKANAKTITLEMNVDKKQETRTGIQNIIQAYEKGTETRPLAIRIIGCLKKADMPELGSSAIGLQVKGKGQNMNLTIEGVGDDATFHGFGVLVRACKYVELRNLGVMMHPEDGISLDTDNEHIWGHHLDIFYGENKGGDKAKGDGSFDVKGTFYCTVSDNHFWDSGKCNLNSNGDEVDYVTYHHNWYDHSDSRHPRVRFSKHLHVFNNYYDGNSKYGVGSTTGSNIFVDKNYFRNCKYPMLISKQGSDINNGEGSSDDTKGTFSQEDGGIIKAFDNYMVGQKKFQPYNANDATNSIHFDAYQAQTRDEQVPATVKALKGGATYNNFDTANDFYDYTPDEKEEVPNVVTGFFGAGRINHGDFQWTFNNETEDTNYEVITELSNALKNYSSKLIGIFGGDQIGGGGDEPGGGDQPGSGDDPTPAPEGTITCDFNNNGAPSSSVFTASGSAGDGKITYDGTYYKTGLKLQSSAGSISFTPQKNYNMTIVLATNKKGRNVKLNDTQTTVSGTENTEGSYYQMAPIAVTAGTQYTITRGSDEAIVMLIILEPIE